MDATNLNVSRCGDCEAARRVLVVDDDPDSADSLVELLGSRGNTIVSANDAQAALKDATAQPLPFSNGGVNDAASGNIHNTNSRLSAQTRRAGEPWSRCATRGAACPKLFSKRCSRRAAPVHSANSGPGAKVMFWLPLAPQRYGVGVMGALWIFVVDDDREFPDSLADTLWQTGPRPTARVKE